ncbi:MAG: hypothetical protein KA941_13350 [Flavobacteriales bacterium]|nr:hypothetical protein [Flavobacteriales bacterium]
MTNKQTDSVTKSPIANGTQENKSATDKTEENAVKDPNTVGNDTEKFLDPNNPHAKQEAPAADHGKATERV